jgi:hypothetical protein
LVSIGLIAPELLTFEEQHVWALIEENLLFRCGNWKHDGWEPDMSLGSKRRDIADEYWEDLLAVAAGEKHASVLPPSEPPMHPDDYEAFSL